RLIRENRKIEYIVCSDPLASDYIRFSGRWLATQYAQGKISIDTHPAEECPFADNYFDLTVMINVLDHVQDAVACVENAIRITKPGGHFVFGQDLTDQEDMLTIGDDVGHPIRLHHEDINYLIQSRFYPALYRVLSREDGRNPK